MSSWLSAALTVADFIAQRVDRVGPVSFEPIGSQPPERAGTPPQAPPQTSRSRERPAETEARAGPAGDARESVSKQRDAIGFEAPRAGGGNDPSSGGSDGGGSGSDGAAAAEGEPRCSFRAPRVADSPTTYEV